MPTPEAKKHRKMKYLVGLLIAFGSFYTAGSILVMNHLVQENNTFCAQRQLARTGIRSLFERRDDWQPEDQITRRSLR